MTIRIAGCAGSMELTTAGWDAAARLAVEHGWVPAGTGELPGDPHDDDDEYREDLDGGPAEAWPDPYYTYFNNGAWSSVRDDDSAAMAEAVERALPSVPEEDKLRHKAVWADGLGDWVIPYGTHVTPREQWSGQNRPTLARLASILRGGGITLC